jgi:predicted MPP superfamily phosphohydrolase
MERTNWLKSSLIVSKIGYNWMGVGFVFASVAFVFDSVQWFVPHIDDATSLKGIVLIGGPLSIWGFLAAHRINIRHVSLHSPKIQTRITIIQISDLHLGDASTQSRLRKVVKTVHQLSPDLIVSTGDLFDGYLPLMRPYVELLKEMKAPLGKYAVSGNHEVYAGLEEALELTRESGFTVLRNESVTVGEAIALAGIEDPAAKKNEDRETTAEKCFKNVSPERYTIFLNHRPSIRPERFERFDLQLSGHTHGGQIFPFHILSKLAYKAKPGLTELAPQTFLYLSRGTGSWGPQLRVFAPPEITQITISPATL